MKLGKCVKAGRTQNQACVHEIHLTADGQVGADEAHDGATGETRRGRADVGGQLHDDHAPGLRESSSTQSATDLLKLPGQCTSERVPLDIHLLCEEYCLESM